MSLVRFNNRIAPSVLNTFFNDEYWPQAYERKASFKPATNIKEDEDSYQIELVVPGFEKDDFKISLENNVLEISSEQKEEKEVNEEGYTQKEYSFQAFSRKFNLPEHKVAEDKISAEYKSGILYVSLPKSEEAKPKPARLINIA